MLKSSNTRQFPIILLCFTLGCGAMPRSFTYFRRVLLQREEQQQQTKRNTKLRQSYIFIARGDKQKVLNSFSISTHDNNPANDSHNTFSIQLNTSENLIINLFILSFVLHPSHTFSHEKISPQISSLPFFQSLAQSISFRMFFFCQQSSIPPIVLPRNICVCISYFFSLPQNSNLRKTSNLYLCYYKNSRLAHKNI